MGRIHEGMFRRLQWGGRSEKHFVGGILAGACGLVVVFPEKALHGFSHLVKNTELIEYPDHDLLMLPC